MSRIADSTIVLASAARIATVSSPNQKNTQFSAVHVIIDVSAITDTPSVVPTIEAYDAASDSWYPLLTGIAITATGNTVLKVGPSITPVANGAANDILPETWRVTMTHADADSITYSIGANLVRLS